MKTIVMIFAILLSACGGSVNTDETDGGTLGVLPVAPVDGGIHMPWAA